MSAVKFYNVRRERVHILYVRTVVNIISIFPPTLRHIRTSFDNDRRLVPKDIKTDTQRYNPRLDARLQLWGAPEVPARANGANLGCRPILPIITIINRAQERKKTSYANTERLSQRCDHIAWFQSISMPSNNTTCLLRYAQHAHE